MKNLRNFFKQNLRLVLVVLCGFLTVWGVLTLVLGGGDSEGWLKVVFIIFGIVLILLGCTVLLMAAALGQSEKANFFLYDSKKKANVPLEELDFARVDRKMMKVMTRISSNASEVWTGNVFDRYDEMMRNFAEIVRGKENPYGYDYELGLFKLILKSCSVNE